MARFRGDIRLWRRAGVMVIARLEEGIEGQGGVMMVCLVESWLGGGCVG